MSEEILGTGLAFPLSVDSRGGIAMVREESDVDQAIAIILGTAPGERPMRPEFGCAIHDYLFDTLDASTVDEAQLTFTLRYTVRATNHRRNLVYPFYVIPADPE